MIQIIIPLMMRVFAATMMRCTEILKPVITKEKKREPFFSMAWPREMRVMFNRLSSVLKTLPVTEPLISGFGDLMNAARKIPILPIFV
ncbi:hypothetical protein ES703_110904 [subsurface metagenome]